MGSRVGPTEFVKSLPFPKDLVGRLITTKNFMIPSQNSIFAIGDCSTIENVELPRLCTGSHAGSKVFSNIFE